MSVQRISNKENNGILYLYTLDTLDMCSNRHSKIREHLMEITKKKSRPGVRIVYIYGLKGVS